MQSVGHRHRFWFFFFSCLFVSYRDKSDHESCYKSSCSLQYDCSNWSSFCSRCCVVCSTVCAVLLQWTCSPNNRSMPVKISLPEKKHQLQTMSSFVVLSYFFVIVPYHTALNRHKLPSPHWYYQHISVPALVNRVGIISLTFTFNKCSRLSTHNSAGWLAQATEIWSAHSCVDSFLGGREGWLCVCLSTCTCVCRRGPTLSFVFPLKAEKKECLPPSCP